jgi:3-deoxy-manno-octulosonate cytidylyltransferase (CMP-KDO synthetase)
MTKAVAIIPARYQSQRLPAKPLADIAGKPMIQHVYERTLRARRIAQVIVATDDERIASVVRAFGGEVVMTSKDLQSGTDRIAVVAESLPNDIGIIVNVQGDEPLIDPDMVDEAVAVVAESTADVGTLVKRIEALDELLNPNVVKVVLSDAGKCLYFSRSPIPFGRDKAQTEWLSTYTYYKHIGMYVFRREFLRTYATLKQTPLEHVEKLEQLRILENGFTINAGITRHDSMPVDTIEDLERVRGAYSKSHE